MTHIIAVTNQKGGVAKTTTTTNLASVFAYAGLKTLLIDIDPQGNASVSSGVAIRELEASVYDVLLGEKGIAELVQSTRSGYDILPANADLAGAQVELSDQEDGNFRIKNALAAVEDQYDMVLIDTPPALNVLTVNALAAANGVLIPVQCEYFALEGLTDLIQTLAKVRTGLNPKLSIIGVVRTMYDGRNRLTLEVSRQLQKHFGDKLCDTLIPRNVRLAEAPSHGLSVIEYDRSCVGAQAYVALGGELMQSLSIVPPQLGNLTTEKQDEQQSKIGSWVRRLIG